MAPSRRELAYADEPPPPTPDDGMGKWLFIGLLVVIGAAIPVYYLAKRVSATNVRDNGGPKYQADTKKPKSQSRPTRVTGELPPPAVGSIEVAKTPTPLTEEEIGRALFEGHMRVFKYAPSPERLSLGWAQASFETSRGKECSSFNLGHLVAGESWEGKFYVFKVAERIRRDPDVWKEVAMRFRAYDNANDGGEDYWRLIKNNFESALAVFDSGNAPAAAEKLCEMGYATANCQQYGTGVSSIYNFIRHNKFQNLADLYAKPGAPTPSAKPAPSKLAPRGTGTRGLRQQVEHAHLAPPDDGRETPKFRRRGRPLEHRTAHGASRDRGDRSQNARPTNEHRRPAEAG